MLGKKDFSFFTNLSSTGQQKFACSLKNDRKVRHFILPWSSPLSVSHLLESGTVKSLSGNTFLSKNGFAMLRGHEGKNHFTFDQRNCKL